MILMDPDVLLSLSGTRRPDSPTNHLSLEMATRHLTNGRKADLGGRLGPTVNQPGGVGLFASALAIVLSLAWSGNVQAVC